MCTQHYHLLGLMLLIYSKPVQCFSSTNTIASFQWELRHLEYCGWSGRRMTTADSVAVSTIRLDSRIKQTTAALYNSLKPAAIPLMDSGKALARSGELVIELTTALNLYGGALSAAGAQMRNAGDSIAHAAALCRFKTGKELVYDEIREAAACLLEASTKLQLAGKEAIVDNLVPLSERIDQTIKFVRECSEQLEAAGACIMLNQPIQSTGLKLVLAGTALQSLSELFASLSPEHLQASSEISQCIRRAAENMVLAGNELQGIKAGPTTGKGWLKGG